MPIQNLSISVSITNIWPETHRSNVFASATRKNGKNTHINIVAGRRRRRRRKPYSGVKKKKKINTERVRRIFRTWLHLIRSRPFGAALTIKYRFIMHGFSVTQTSHNILIRIYIFACTPHVHVRYVRGRVAARSGRRRRLFARGAAHPPRMERGGIKNTRQVHLTVWIPSRRNRYKRPPSLGHAVSDRLNATTTEPR